MVVNSVKPSIINEPLLHRSHLLSKKYSPFKVGIVIPTLNEEKNITGVIKNLSAVGYKNILVIDGKSNDNTITLAEKHGAKIFVQKGRGKGRALREVLCTECADYLNADSLLMMDADGSMDPREIPRFVNALLQGADIVKGSRFVSGGYTYDMNCFRRLGNTLMTLSVNILFDTRYTDLCYGYVLFSRKALEKLSPLLVSNYFDIEAEIFIKAKKLGLKIVEIPSIEYRRVNGVSNLGTFKDGYKILSRILSEVLD